MRWFLIFTIAIVLMVCSGIRQSSADIEIWYELEPIGTMGSPVILNVEWPDEPPKGIDFRSGIYIAASVDDHDHGDAYAVDTDTWEWEWLGSFSVPGSPETTWTCSWGVFEETNSDEAIGYASVTWRPTEPFQDTVQIDCVADDPHDTLGPNESGDRDDSPDSDFKIYNIRWPETITAGCRRLAAGDPAPEEGVFVYYNTVYVEDNRGNPYDGLEVTQDLATGFFKNTHADGLTGAENFWLPNDANGITDENGFINDFDRVENEGTEQDAQGDTTHIAKMAWIPLRPACKIIYWNPLPTCAGQHANPLTLPPP